MADQTPTINTAPDQPGNQPYPRKGWLRVIRQVLLLRWRLLLVVLVIYLGLSLVILFTQSHNDLGSLLDVHRVINALLDPIKQSTFISIFVFLMSGVLILSGYWAKKDEEREIIWFYEFFMMSSKAQTEEWEKRPAPPGFKLRHTLIVHTKAVFSVAWSPDGYTLASASYDNTVRLWDAQTAQPLHILVGHTDLAIGVAWSPDGHMLASGSTDRTIRLWNPLTGQCMRSLEGHTDIVMGVFFSPDGRLLGSKSVDKTVRLWRTDIWESISTLYEYCDRIANLSFHPTLPVLATLGQNERAIRIWDLDMDTILRSHSSTSISYTNAKVVLLGDSGVGKSGLGLVLSGSPFTLTESTHARRIWNFDKQEIDPAKGVTENRETFLWDLAGQPGYRLIHQLHLNEVSVALVVFDARSETDPFAGVYHWDRALRQAQRVQGSSALPLKKILVQARVDRGGVGVGPERIQALVNECGFDGYLETSAKEGWHIIDLQEAIRKTIDWNVLP